MISLVLGVVSILLVAVSVTFLLSPLETLETSQYSGGQERGRARGGADKDVQADVFVVFVSGIGSISGDALLPAESRFLDRLSAELPRARIVRDVFPYAPSGRPLLTGQRFFSWFWRVVGRDRDRGGPLLPAVLNIRNLYQVLVSADRRYGPLYSHGIAEITADRLQAAGYPFGSGLPLVLLGSSGGGQISAGAAKYLAEIAGAPVSIVTFGGVTSADPGIAAAHKFFSYYGESDSIYRLGRIAFPGRWPSSPTSTWNEARADGRLDEVNIGEISHSGSGGYLDPTEWHDGESRLDRTVAAVSKGVMQAVNMGSASDQAHPTEQL